MLEACRPPHGGRGLKYKHPKQPFAYQRRPPHGGRGLKCLVVSGNATVSNVALPTEGVD